MTIASTETKDIERMFPLQPICPNSSGRWTVADRYRRIDPPTVSVVGRETATGTVEGGDAVDGGRVVAAVALGLLAAVAGAGGLFVTERAGGDRRWWWILGLVVALPT